MPLITGGARVPQLWDRFGWIKHQVLKKNGSQHIAPHQQAEIQPVAPRPACLCCPSQFSGTALHQALEKPGDCVAATSILYVWRNQKRSVCLSRNVTLNFLLCIFFYTLLFFHLFCSSSHFVFPVWFRPPLWTQMSHTPGSHKLLLCSVLPNVGAFPAIAAIRLWPKVTCSL